MSRKRLIAGLLILSVSVTGCASGVSDGAESFPEDCTRQIVRAGIESFLEAFNKRDIQTLDALFAPASEFEWYSVSGSGSSRRMGETSRDRSTLLEYFKARFEQDEVLELRSFSSSYERERNLAHFSFRISHEADDLKPRVRRGKGAFNCGTEKIIVWSM